MSEDLARSEIVARAIEIKRRIIRPGPPRVTSKEVYAASEEIDALRLHPGITPEEERYLQNLLETFGQIHAIREDQEQREAAKGLRQQQGQQPRQTKP